MKKKIIEKFNIEEFITSGNDNSKEFNKSVKISKSEIKKLKPKKWNDYFYKLRIKEVPIKLFGKDASIIWYQPLRTKYDTDMSLHKKQWCPYDQPPAEYWVKIGNKMWKWYGSMYWSLDNVKAERVEVFLLEETPVFKKYNKEIAEYSEIEIKKIQDFLHEKYPYEELSDVINRCTDPEYWY